MHVNRLPTVSVECLVLECVSLWVFMLEVLIQSRLSVAFIALCPDNVIFVCSQPLNTISAKKTRAHFKQSLAAKRLRRRTS